jgi:CubicO group peptidase (beta-lactamase class C family)
MRHLLRLASLASLASLVLAPTVGCGGADAPPPVTPAPAVRSAKPEPAAPKADVEHKATADTKVAIAPNVLALAPAGWTYATREGGAVFRTPERDLTISMTKVAAAKAADAVALAWTKLALGAPVKTDHDETHEGVGPWDEVLEIQHETPVAAGRVLVTNVRRKGNDAYVTVLDGKPAAFSRRGGELRQLVFGLDVPGLEEENLSAVTASAFDAEKVKAYAEFLESVRERTHVPGFSVAVVQGGKVVFERGFGEREVGKKGAVGTRTLFAIGSITKSLSSLLVAKMVSDGKLKWDAKVKDLYPAFKTGDAAFTDKLTVADTFCACTGMPRKDMDLLFEYASVKPERVMAWFSDLKPTTAFGETFQYSNQMTALGGFVAARVARPGVALGEAYEGALQSMVLGPMGMKDSTSSFDKAKRAQDRAAPHATSLPEGPDAPKALPFEMERFVAPVAPAGAVFSTIHDMARYALVELGKGKTPEGKRVFDEAALLERRKPRVKTNAKGHYGLGLGVAEYLGVEVVAHDGGTFGYRSRMFLVPGKDLGLVVLTNSADAGSLLAAAQQRLLELTLGAKETASRDVDRGLATHRAALEHLKKDLGPIDEAVGSSLVRTYSSSSLGKVVVSREGSDYWFDVGEWRSRLAYTKAADGTQRVFLVDPPAAGLPLELDQGSLEIKFGQDVYKLSPVASPAAK